jgi:YggT family protein
VFVLKHFVGAVAAILDIVLVLYMIALFAAVAISWFAPRSRHPAIVFLKRITEPVLRRIRRAMPFLVQAGFDLTPIILFFVIHFLRRFLVAALYDAASRIG